MFATIAVLALAASNSAMPAMRRGGCDDWGCGLNGPSANGIATLRGSWGCCLNGPSATGLAVPSSVRVTAIQLADGERIDLR